MSNSTSQPTALSFDIIRALTILPIMDRYILIILYTSGVLGSLLNILTLLQKKFHKNPCSLYFLWASITDFFVMNAVLMVDALRYFNPTLFILINSISIWCKLQKYAVFLLPCLSSTFITLACIDRFCTSSHNQHVRQLSQFKISRILILIVLIIWMLFSSHTLILFDIPRNQCRSSSDWFLFILIIDGYFFSMFNGAIVPIFLSIFGFLIYRNVRLSRQRVAPIANTNSNRPTVTTHGLHLNRQNLHLITMLLVQSSLTVFLNIPYMAIYLNSFYSNTPTNQLLLLVYAIFTYIGRWFWFLNYAKTFYLNNLASQIFRTALRERLIHIGLQSRVRILPRTGS